MAPPSLTKNAADSMTHPADDGRLPSWITFEGSTFVANGHPVLTLVPPNITATPSPTVSSDKAKNDRNLLMVGCFLGFKAGGPPKCRHVVSLGKLRGVLFMSIFRFKVWWTTHWVGSNGRDVEHETQLMILDRSDSGRPYVLLLPLVEGPFRASLQPGVDDYVDVCVESGSTRVARSVFRSCLYMHVGDDPYVLVRDAIREIRFHLGTFRLLEEKVPPAIMDKFGWCTWDAFYLTVHPQVTIYATVEVFHLTKPDRV